MKLTLLFTTSLATLATSTPLPHPADRPNPTTTNTTMNMDFIPPTTTNTTTMIFDLDPPTLNPFKLAARALLPRQVKNTPCCWVSDELKCQAFFLFDYDPCQKCQDMIGAKNAACKAFYAKEEFTYRCARRQITELKCHDTLGYVPAYIPDGPFEKGNDEEGWRAA
ncbi:hypothetical protein B0A50_07624 [Salinomyces thailandicus]|uniref:Uncharacterized protein n=1 Tax=Salinomyces thailandicus TaxID=706561 RepID=A0A4U0TMM6_9PEZI|nr:hypothetical protein B0A50_07624 [Salinomyces thailandica]